MSPTLLEQGFEIRSKTPALATDVNGKQRRRTKHGGNGTVRGSPGERDRGAAMIEGKLCDETKMTGGKIGPGSSSA